MSDEDVSALSRALPLNQISTRWSIVNDPVQVVLRYAPAVQAYLRALLKDPADAEEVSQEFVVRILDARFAGASPDRGRFRDYLKVSVRNAAMEFLHKRQRQLNANAVLVAEAERTGGAVWAEEAGGDWDRQWRACLLEKVWRLLESHERRSRGNLFYTCLRAASEHPEETSDALAGRASQAGGHALSPEAFRKQLSRARRMFAELLANEVAATIRSPTPEAVAEELGELGLLPYVRPYLPPEPATVDQ